MSESDAAFMKIKIERAGLLAWLEDRPPLATDWSDWSDWRDIGGEYYGAGGHHDIADIPAAEFNGYLAQCDAQLRGYERRRLGKPTPCYARRSRATHEEKRDDRMVRRPPIGHALQEP